MNAEMQFCSDGGDENATETSEATHSFSVEEKEAQEVRDQRDRGLLFIKIAGLQQWNFMVIIAFRLCLLCVFEENQKFASVWVGLRFLLETICLGLNELTRAKEGSS